MTPFTETLRSTGERLDIPQPARSRVLLEIAADLEDLYAAYRARGLPDDEARRKAVETVDLSEESLRDLAALHSGPVRRLLDRLSAAALARWEYTLLTLIVLMSLAICLGLSRGGRVVADAGIFVWPVLLTGVSALILSLCKVYQLYLKQDHNRCRAGRGLGPLLGLVVMLPLLGLSGTWYHALRLSTGDAGETRPLPAVLLEWGIQTTALLQISLGLAVLGALAWFLLADKVGRIESEEAAILFEP